MSHHAHMLKLARDFYRRASTPLGRVGAYLGIVAVVDAVRGRP